MDALLEFLISALIELIGPLAGFIFDFALEIILAVFFYAFQTVFGKAFATALAKFSAPFALICLFHGLMGAICGYFSLMFFPQLLIHDTWLRVANMIATPLIASGAIVLLSYVLDGQSTQRSRGESYLRVFFFLFFILFSRAYFSMTLPVAAPPSAPDSRTVQTAPRHQETAPRPNLTKPTAPPPRSDPFALTPEPHSDSATPNKRITLEDLKIPQESASRP